MIHRHTQISSSERLAGDGGVGGGRGLVRNKLRGVVVLQRHGKEEFWAITSERKTRTLAVHCDGAPFFTLPSVNICQPSRLTGERREVDK